MGTLETRGTFPLTLTLADIFYADRVGGGTDDDGYVTLQQIKNIIFPSTTASVAVDYTQLATDTMIVEDTALASRQVTLIPAADGVNLPPVTVIKSSNKNSLNIIGDTGELVGGKTTLSIYNRNESCTLQSDGVAWQVVGSHRPQDENITTGAIVGCDISLNVDTTKYDVSAGTIAIEDWSNPLTPRISTYTFDGATAQIPDDPFNKIFTRVWIIEDPTDETKAILEQEAEGLIDGTTRRTKVELPIVLHQALDGEILGFSDDKQIAYGWLQSLNDISHARRAANTGNIISASNGIDLKIDKSVGKTNNNFINSVNSPWFDPSGRVNIATVEQAFVYQAQSPAGPFVGGGVTDLDSGQYDLGGVITVMPGGNKWQIQRIYNFGQSDTMTIGYGQTIYSSLSDAQAGVTTESFVQPPNAIDGVLIASVILKSGATIFDSNNVIVNV